MSDIGNGSASQKPLDDLADSENLLTTISNPKFNVSLDDDSNNDCLDSNKKPESDLSQELDAKTNSVPELVGTLQTQTGLEAGDASEGMKANAPDGTVAEDPKHCSEKANGSEAFCVNREIHVENDSGNFEKETPEGSDIGIIHLPEKSIETTSEDENARGKQSMDETSSEIKLSDDCESFSRNLSKEKKINGAAPEEENFNLKTENSHSYEERSKVLELQASEGQTLSDDLKNLKLSEELEKTNMIEEKRDNQKLDKPDDITELNIQKNQSNIKSLSNQKTENTSQAANQTYQDALKFFQSLCDQASSTMIGRKSDGYFQIRSQGNKCIELGTEIQNMKAYLESVKSDIVDLKIRCSQIKNSLHDMSHK